MISSVSIALVVLVMELHVLGSRRLYVCWKTAKLSFLFVAAGLLVRRSSLQLATGPERILLVLQHDFGGEAHLSLS